MKQFFNVLFGGLGAVACGIIIASASVYSWSYVKPYLVKDGHFSLANVTSAVIPQPKDGTTISGFRRTVRYSASEEEDLINAAVDALPQSPDGKITAGAYILKNLTRGDSPIEYNADKLLPIASVTKLVTAVVVRKYMDPNEKVSITRDIMATYGNTALFKVGETFQVEDLLHPLLMVSSNDAAEAFAQDFGREAFIEKMNDFVQSIGAYRTYFDDPSGLSEKNISTANDLALILDWIYKNDQNILDITAQKTKTIRSHTWINPTHFLSWSYYKGGKNGYTPEANRTSASLFTAGPNQNLYAVILLDSDSRDSDTVKLLAKAKK